MKKKAVISISSKQDDDDAPVEVVTPGNFYKRNDKYYAVYKETEISGMKGTTTTLKISPEKFSLIRMGTTQTKMDFYKKDDRSLSLYDTPYGTLELEIKTNKLKVDMQDNGGEVFIDYNLSIVGQKPQNTILKINIKVDQN